MLLMSSVYTCYHVIVGLVARHRCHNLPPCLRKELPSSLIYCCVVLLSKLQTNLRRRLQFIVFPLSFPLFFA